MIFFSLKLRNGIESIRCNFQRIWTCDQKLYTVAATTVSLQCISIPQKMQLTCERQSQRHAHSCGDWKPLLVIVSFEICVWIPFVWVNICLSISIRVRGKKWFDTEQREKKRKKNKVNGWFSEPFDYEKSKQKCCCLRSFIVTYHILVCSFISLHLPTTYARERLVLSSVLLFHRENCVSMCGEREQCVTCWNMKQMKSRAILHV